MFKQLVDCEIPQSFPRFYIYKLTFQSGKTYIGQHTQRQEKDPYITSSSYYNHNKENDPLIERKIILFVNDRETLDIMETICIMQDKANNIENVNFNFGAMIVPSFCYGWNKGIKTGKLSDSTRRNMSEAHKGIIFSEEHKKHLSESRKGWKPSEEQRKRHSEFMKGRSPTNKGVKMTDEQRRKCSESHKGQIPFNKGEKGRKCWNNGVKNIMSFECPGEGWVRGRIKC